MLEARPDTSGCEAAPGDRFETQKLARGLEQGGVGWSVASHLELLAPHGLHVAFLANCELVGHGVAPGVVLGPGEVLPILLYLRDNLEVATLFNGVTGEPWARGQAEEPGESRRPPAALGKGSPLLGRLADS